MSNDFSGHVSVGGWRKDNFSANLGDSARQLSNIWVRDAMRQLPKAKALSEIFKVLILDIWYYWNVFSKVELFLFWKLKKIYKCIIY